MDIQKANPESLPSADQVLLDKISSELGGNVLSTHELSAGMNNRLFEIETDDGKYLLKKYQRDERERLEREYRALSFLRDHGFDNVPRPVLRGDDDYVAVYSYEAGNSKLASEATLDDIDNVLDFVIELQSFKSGNIETEFPPAVMGCFSLKDYIRNIDFRFGKFLECINDPNVHPLIKDLAESTKVVEYMTEHRNQLLERVESLHDQNVSDTEKRRSPVDFGFHNIIVKEDGGFCFVDFEYFGWDDPQAIIADFVNHDAQQKLPSSHKEHFITEYIRRANLSKDQAGRLNLVLDLKNLEWLSIYLYGMTPDRLASRAHADVDFDLEKALQAPIDKVRSRYFNQS